MGPKVIAEKNYYRFCHLEGNEYIASEFALVTILKLIHKFKINSVLELGVGIGAIADTVLRYAHHQQKKISYSGTESNDYCRSVLVDNIENINALDLYNDLSEISSQQKFDLIIVDGQEKQLQKIKGYCKKETLIFIEGDRTPQMDVILECFPQALSVNIISLQKNKPYAHGLCTPNYYVGGGRLIFTNPDAEAKVYWLKEKVRTNLIRRIRKFKTKF